MRGKWLMHWRAAGVALTVGAASIGVGAAVGLTNSGPVTALKSAGAASPSGTTAHATDTFNEPNPTAPDTTTTTSAPAPEPDPTPAPAAPRPQSATPATTAAPAPAPAPAPDPAPAPAGPPTSPAPGGTLGAILSAMNADRAANGLPALGWNDQCAGFSQSWSNWMAANQSLTHSNLQGSLAQTNFSTMGENILVAPTGTSVAAMEQAWMNSPAHRANILSGAFTVAGVGLATSSDGRVWVTVDFGG